jgi:hypothetical protein
VAEVNLLSVVACDQCSTVPWPQLLPHKEARCDSLIHTEGISTDHLVLVHTTLDCRAAAIQERVTAVLRSIPKEAFADSFQKLYER